MQGDTAEAQAELEALRRERALLIDKLNNHPEVRKYAGGMPLRDYYPSKPMQHGTLAACQQAPCLEGTFFVLPCEECSLQGAETASRLTGNVHLAHSFEQYILW